MRLFIGVMSGTSLDGADAVLADFDAIHPAPVVLAAAHAPFDATLRQTLLALQRNGPDELHRGALAAHALVDVYAAVALQVCRDAGVLEADVVAIGVHGQTVRHRPELGYTLQLNAPARLAERCAIAVVSDFRSRDIAAGGQGAPLVPAFHATVFGHATRHRLVVNLGGMSNVTDLPAGPDPLVRGWDCGPGNVLLDAWISDHRGTAYDADGAWSSSGRVDDALLEQLLDEPWFDRPPPKSTGRDLFDRSWLLPRLRDRERRPEDVQATLAELTATTIARSALRHAGTVDDVIVCGGGARNADLLRRLTRHFTAARATTRVMTCSDEDAGGIAPDHVEALAFAWLAARCIDGLPGNLPAVTGAAGPRVLGAIYPR